VIRRDIGKTTDETEEDANYVDDFVVSARSTKRAVNESPLLTHNFAELLFLQRTDVNNRALKGIEFF